MTDTARTTLALFLTAFLTAAIGMLTLLPLAVPGPPGGDKAHHIIGFAALVLPGCILRPNWAGALLAFAVVYGGAIELVQPHVGRSGEWTDFAADVAGAFAGGLAGAFIGRRLWSVRPTA